MITKSISINGTGCKFGGCVRKAVVVTSGDLPFGPESGLRVEGSVLTGRQKSAAGVVVPGNGRRPKRSSARRVMGAGSRRRDS